MSNYVHDTTIIASCSLQAVEKGCDADKPRNLAKSVTVENKKVVLKVMCGYSKMLLCTEKSL